MKNCRWGAVCAMTASGVLAGSSCGDPTTLSAEGRVWRATWSEEFLVELSIEEANCFAATVGAQTRLAGPLKDERRDDTPGSVFSAMDSCATDATSGRTARRAAARWLVVRGAVGRRGHVERSADRAGPLHRR